MKCLTPGHLPAICCTPPPPSASLTQVMMQLQPGLSAMGAVRSTVAAQGPLGLYKGMLAPLATVAAFNALLFSSRGAAERILSPDGALQGPSRDCGEMYQVMYAR